MPGRNFSSEKYRYSINGQEKTPEVFEGSTTAEYWQYDSRIGRRWNVDPKPSVSYSVYAVFENSPIWKSDVLGDTIKPVQLSASQERALRRTNTNISESTCQGCHLKATVNTNVPIRPVAPPTVGPLSAEVRNRTPEEQKKVEAAIKFIAGIQKNERERAEDHRAADDIPGVGTIMRGLRRGFSGDIDGMAQLTTQGAVEVASMYSGGGVVVNGVKGLTTFGAVSAEGAAKGVTQVEQYALRAAEDGFYPVMKRGFANPQELTWLNKGDVWKFGTTKNPLTRYSQSFLDNTGAGLRYSTEFSGTLKQATKLERMKILNFRGQNGFLPAGNKIVR